MGTPKPATAFTARETELITIAFQCLKTRPDIDYNLMAVRANLKGAKSANDSFNRLYSKILAGKSGGGDEAATAASASPAKGSPLKRKGAAEGGGADEDDDDEDEVASPLKKVKGKKGTVTPRKGKAKAKGKGKDEVKADVDGNDGCKLEEEDGDNIVVKVKAEVLNDDGGGVGEDV